MRLNSNFFTKLWKTFNWPLRSNIAIVHNRRVFYGSKELKGTGHFNAPSLLYIERLFKNENSKRKCFQINNQIYIINSVDNMKLLRYNYIMLPLIPLITLGHLLVPLFVTVIVFHNWLFSWVDNVNLPL